MDDARIELVNHLFAVVTEIAEAALDAALSGQAATTPPLDLAGAARTLCRRAAELNSVGTAILVVIANEDLSG